jgi:hypothetical protein
VSTPQCAGIKAFVVNLVIQRSSNEELFRSDKIFMNKINMVLVQIVKQARQRTRPTSPLYLACEHTQELPAACSACARPCRTRSGRMPGPRSSLTSSRLVRPTSRFAKTTWRYGLAAALLGTCTPLSNAPPTRPGLLRARTDPQASLRGGLRLLARRDDVRQGQEAQGVVQQRLLAHLPAVRVHHG